MLFLLVLVPPRQNSSVLRDMAHVVGVLISHVGIFELFCDVAWYGDIYISFLYLFVIVPH